MTGLKPAPSAAERDTIVAAARNWIGTPFVHGMACRGAGCDCLGLVRGLRAELGAPVPQTLPPYAPGLALSAEGELLLAGLAAHLPAATPDLAEGQVLVFRLRPGAPAGHLAILTKTPPGARMVHAYDNHGVVESPLSGPWLRRIVARFELL